MPITAKQLAQQLGLSTASVSFALNGRPGVSAETRARVLDAARALGYDPQAQDRTSKTSGTIAFVYYNRRQIFNTDFFSRMAQGAEEALHGSAYEFKPFEISAIRDIPTQIESLIRQNPKGILLLATEMHQMDLIPFAALDLPIVLLDTCLSCGFDRIQINNHEGCRMAVERLFGRYGQAPGLLNCSGVISNFVDRNDGYYLALRQSGVSPAQCISHELAADQAGAKQDMLNIIDSGAPLAKSYFGCWDGVTLGAMEAFLERGYRIPEDIGFIGFDNISEAAQASPSLTTINVPAAYMGSIAAKRILEILHEDEHHPVVIEIGTSLITRDSA